MAPAYHKKEGCCGWHLPIIGRKVGVGGTCLSSEGRLGWVAPAYHRKEGWGGWYLPIIKRKVGVGDTCLS